MDVGNSVVHKVLQGEVKEELELAGDVPTRPEWMSTMEESLKTKIDIQVLNPLRAQGGEQDNPTDQDGLLLKHQVSPPFPVWGYPCRLYEHVASGTSS